MSSTICFTFLFLTVIAFVASDDPGNCPDYTDKVCPHAGYRINDCCKQSDCPSYAICCVQACGNVCRMKAAKPIGTPLVDGTECEYGRVDEKRWYQKLFG